MTIASGPNAILFAFGNPGGVADASRKQAEFRPRSISSYRQENFDGHSVALDANHVLALRRAALRFALLDANHRTFRPTNSDGNRRFYGAMTLRPLPDTTVRLNAERIRREASRASMVVVHDYVSPWLDGGRPTFDDAGVTAATAAATVTGRLTTAGLSSFLTRSGNNSPVVIASNTPGDQPVANWPNSANVVGLHTKAPVLQEQAYEWSLVRPEVSDPAANIFGDGNQVRERGRVLNAFVEQKIARNRHLEGGFVREHAATRQVSWVDGNNSFDIFVDPNRYLPDGITANPNLGKLYSQTNPLGSRGTDDRQKSRLTASFQLDFSGRAGWTAWLGRHRLAAMSSYSEYTTAAQSPRLVIAGAPSVLSAQARTNLGDTSRLVTVRTYLGNGVDHVSAPVPGGALDFQPTLNFSGPGGEPFAARVDGNPDGSFSAATGTVQNVISRSIADQSYQLRDRLNATYGWRESRVRMKTSFDPSTTTAQANGLFPDLENARFPGSWDYLDRGQRSIGSWWGAPSRGCQSIMRSPRTSRSRPTPGLLPLAGRSPDSTAPARTMASV